MGITRDEVYSGWNQVALGRKETSVSKPDRDLNVFEVMRTRQVLGDPLSIFDSSTSRVPRTHLRLIGMHLHGPHEVRRDAPDSPR